MSNEDIAWLLHERGHGTYVPAGAGSIFLDQLPAEPATALAVTDYPGPPGNAGIGHDQPRVQVTVRNEDQRAAKAAAQAIYDDFVGMRSRHLASGAWLALCHPVQSGPVWMPSEERGRTRYVVNLAFHLHRPTVHRP